MAKFAKLFDVADTQVLFMVTDNDGDPSLKMTTEINGAEISQDMTFRDAADHEAMWDKTLEILQALNEESAIKFHAEMTRIVSTQMCAPADGIASSHPV